MISQERDNRHGLNRIFNLFDADDEIPSPL